MTSTSYLVEKKDGWLAHNRAGNGHALLLPAGECPAAHADLGSVATCHLTHEIVRVGRACRLIKKNRGRGKDALCA